MLKTTLLIVMLMGIITTEVKSNEVCDNIGNLTDIVRSHTDILNDFPLYQGKTLVMENEIRRLKSGAENIKGTLNLVANYTDYLLVDVAELKGTSNSFLQRFVSLDKYQGTTDYLVDDVAQLKASAESHEESINGLEAWKEKTTTIQNDVTKIRESITNHTLKGDEVARQRIKTLDETCAARHKELQNQLRQVSVLSESQKKTTEKLDELTGALNKVTNEQNEMKKWLGIQNQTIQKVNNIAVALEGVIIEQQKLQKNIQDLNNKLQELIKKQTTPLPVQVVQPPTTQTTLIPTTSTTSAPNGPRIIRKHAHARGTNIVITV